MQVAGSLFRVKPSMQTLSPHVPRASQHSLWVQLAPAQLSGLLFLKGATLLHEISLHDAGAGVGAAVMGAIVVAGVRTRAARPRHVVDDGAPTLRPRDRNSIPCGAQRCELSVVDLDGDPRTGRAGVRPTIAWTALDRDGARAEPGATFRARHGGQQRGEPRADRFAATGYSETQDGHGRRIGAYARNAPAF